MFFLYWYERDADHNDSSINIISIYITQLKEMQRDVTWLKYIIITLLKQKMTWRVDKQDVQLKHFSLIELNDEEDVKKMSRRW